MEVVHQERCALLSAARAQTWCLGLLGNDPEANVAPVLMAVHVRMRALSMRAPETARRMRAVMETLRLYGLPLNDTDRAAIAESVPGQHTKGHNVAEVLWLAHLFELDASPEAQVQAFLALMSHYHAHARFLRDGAPPPREAKEAYFVSGVRTDLNEGQSYSPVLIANARLGGLLVRDLDDGCTNAAYLISLLHPSPKLAHQLMLRTLPGGAALVLQAHSVLYDMATWIAAAQDSRGLLRGASKGHAKYLVKEPRFGATLRDRQTLVTWAHTLEMLGDPAESVSARRTAYADVTGVVFTEGAREADEQGFGRVFYVVVTRLCLNV
jgi:hypothetical protein